MKIFYCRKCKALDYAEGNCSKCGSTELDEADIEFLLFCSNMIQSPTLPDLMTLPVP